MTIQEIEAVLRSLSLRTTEDVPVLAVARGADGGAGKALFANQPMLSLFEAADLAALSARLFASADPGGRRLNELLSTLPEDGGPRLERLRFFFGPAAQTFTFLCRKLAPPTPGAASVFVAAALGIRTPLLRIAPANPAPAPLAEMVVPQQAAGGPDPAAIAQEISAPIADAPFATDSPMTLEEVREALAPRFGAKRTIRFLWRTDAADKITEITPPLAEVVGAAAANLLGRDFGDVAKYLQFDPDGRLAQAFAKRETWSGIEVLWPIAGAAAAVPVSLGGLPAFDREGEFDGYRGFGVIHIDRLLAAEPRYFGAAEMTAHSNAGGAAANVVPLRPIMPVALAATIGAGGSGGAQTEILSSDEQKAFAEIAVALNGEPALAVPPAQEIVDPPAEANDEAIPSAEPEPRAALNEQPGGLAEPDAEAVAAEAQSVSQPEPSRAAAATASSAAAPEAPREAAERVLEEETAAPAEGLDAGAARAAWLADHGIGANAVAILDRLGLGLLVSRDDVPIYVNRYLLDLLGYADEDAFHAAGGLTQLFEQAPSSGGESVNLRTAAGQTAAVQARLQTIEWDDLPATLFTFKRDDESEARMKLEAGLRRRDNDVRELNAILDTATDGLAIIDGQGRILSLNRSAEALFGYEQADVVGQPFSILLAPESEAKAREYFDGLRANGVASLLNDGREVVGRPRQGGAIPMFMTLGRVGGSRDGQTEQKYCALLRDMTHWKKVEQDLQQARNEAERASALKSDFLAKVSHEIRTPLNAILGFAEVILEERFGPIGTERYRDYLRDIHTSGAHVMSLVNDLLDLSKIEAGKMDLAFAPIDANRVISECVSIMQPQANRERVIMRLSLAPHLPKIMADERSLRQIVLNLLSNAVKFNEPGGQVIIASALTDAGHAVIRIRDTGIGMSEQEIETALEPFRQVATSRQTTGTGLGLPLTKALIEANRAFLTIKSRKNEGTLVEVVFPPARVAAA